MKGLLIIIMLSTTINLFGQDTIYLEPPARYYSEIDTIVAKYHPKYHKWKHSRELIVFPNDSFSNQLVYYLDDKRIRDTKPYSTENYILTENEFRFYLYFQYFTIKEVWKYQQLEDSLFYLERQVGQTIDRGYANSLVPYDRRGHQFVTTTLEGDTLFTINHFKKHRNGNIHYKHRRFKYYEKGIDSLVSIKDMDTFDRQILINLMEEVKESISPCPLYPEYATSFFSIVITKEGKIHFNGYLRESNFFEDHEIIRIIHTLPSIKPFTKNGEPVNVEWIMPIRYKYED